MYSSLFQQPLMQYQNYPQNQMPPQIAPPLVLPDSDSQRAVQSQKPLQAFGIEGQKSPPPYTGNSILDGYIHSFIG